jgi:hypothetical protein
MFGSFQGLKERLGFVKNAYFRAVERELSSLNISVGDLLAERPELSDRFAFTCEKGRKGGMSPGEVACWISLCLLQDRLIKTSQSSPVMDFRTT